MRNQCSLITTSLFFTFQVCFITLKHVPLYLIWELSRLIILKISILFVLSWIGKLFLCKKTLFILTHMEVFDTAFFNTFFSVNLLSVILSLFFHLQTFQMFSSTCVISQNKPRLLIRHVNNAVKHIKINFDPLNKTNQKKLP